jgi:hypothetical protein
MGLFKNQIPENMIIYIDEYMKKVIKENYDVGFGKKLLYNFRGQVILK